MKSLTIALVLSFVLTASTYAADQLELGQAALRSMTGCYLIDYSYTESEGLKPGYVRDTRVYDVNRDKSVKEWIFAEEFGTRRVRLQHILFAADLTGNIMEGSFLKHQVEDWEYDAGFLYDFTGPASWAVKGPAPGLWTRRITNLDEGLRYQCAASWRNDTTNPEWSCDNYAPIPGRETRDMGRRDYNTLDRGTRIVAYGNSWLERQANVKTIHELATGARTPLAKELGKNWYVRLPDEQCAQAQTWIKPRLAFWGLLREAWDEVLVGDGSFLEKTLPGQPSRFMKIMMLEEQFHAQLDNPAIRQAAKKAILKTIADYRAR